jgi:hypothetical protein
MLDVMRKRHEGPKDPREQMIAQGLEMPQAAAPANQITPAPAGGELAGIPMPKQQIKAIHFHPAPEPAKKPMTWGG